MKKCTNCKVRKTLSKFYRRSAVPDGRSSWCKVCFDSHCSKVRRTPKGRLKRSIQRKKHWKKYLTANRAKKRKDWWKNRERNVQSLRDRYHANPKKYLTLQRVYQLRSWYGLTFEQYDEMLKSQGGGCKICRRTDNGKNKWHVDHDHKTGKLRGLLCGTCNSGLGFFKDNPEILRSAANYLEENLKLIQENTG